MKERIVVQHEGVLVEPEGQMVLDFRPSEVGADVAASIDSSTNGPPSERAPNTTNPDLGYDTLMAPFEKGCRLDTDASTYEDAVLAYEACIELDSQFSDAHCNLGAVLYNAGKADLARRCFERCLEIDSRHVEAHFNLANLLEEKACDARIFFALA